jgi:hypothetical protein
MKHLPKIYCDMDGVLCDFPKGIEKVIGKNINQWSYGSKSEKWDPIKNTPKFWHTLPWTSSGRTLWNFIKKYDTHILSAYVEETFDPNCIPGKSHWARTNLGLSSNKINLVRRAEKQNYATNMGKPCVLIDDYLKNTTQFKQKGGHGITYVNANQAIAELKKLGF